MPNYILTGTPGAGKTAMLRRLELDGHVVIEEAATDVIALGNACGHAEPWHDPAFIDTIVTLQRFRQTRTHTADGAPIFYDRSPICTLALSHYLGLAPSRLLVDEVDRVVADGVYELTVFFVRHQGFLHATSARRIGFDDSLVFERLHEQIYRDLGFQLTEVPAGPLIDRVALVEQTIEHLQS